MLAARRWRQPTIMPSATIGLKVHRGLAWRRGFFPARDPNVSASTLDARMEKTLRNVARTPA